MKYGAMNFPIKPLMKEIEEISSLGFDYIEISMDPPEALPEKVQNLKDEILGATRNYGMGVIAHMPTFVSTADLYASVRRVSIEETVAALETASVLRIKKVVLHPPYTLGLGKFVPKKIREYGLSSLNAILEKAKGLNIMVCLENMFATAGSLTTPREFRTVLEEFPDLSMTLDIGHAFVAGGMNNVLEFVNGVGNRIVHVHANDNLGREDNHLPVGAGLIDFHEVLRELKSLGYNDTMTVEVFSRDRDYLRISREKLIRLWEELP
jgi:sugar phosphate isomerase/epimerase